MNSFIKISSSVLLTAGTILSASWATQQSVKAETLTIDGSKASYQTSVEPGKENGKNLLSKAVPVTVKADGKEYAVNTKYKDVKSLLVSLNIHMGELDTANVSLSAALKPGMDITVQRVTMMSTEKIVPVALKVKTVETNDLAKGMKKLQNQGEVGSRSVLTRQVFVDGKLAGETESAVIIEEPVAKTILVGTKNEQSVKKVKAEEKKKVAVAAKKAAEPKKAVEKKATVKKVAEKKTAVKKTAVKKTAVKKTTVKKASSASSKNWKTFRLSFYTNLPSENGGYTITASGKSLRYGMAASNYYSIGKDIYLEGMGTFTVEDRGGPNFNNSTRLDILIPRKSGESNSTYLRRVNNMGLKNVKGYVK